MRPLILKGHTRALTCVKYNHDGDLLFTSSKDNRPTMWYTDNGERVGTFDGHRGTVWTLDVQRTSERLLTGGADMTVKMWHVHNGEMIQEFPTAGPVRCVEWAEGDNMFACLSDPFRMQPSTVAIFQLAAPGQDQHDTPAFTWTQEAKKAKFTKLTWTPLNREILTGDEEGVMRLHDPETGKVIREMREHTKKINCFKWNNEKTMLITGSADCTSKLWDASTWEVIKTYEAGCPVNACAISSIKEHVLVAGGQEAMEVTTTSARVGKFETKFFHMVFEEQWGSVKGHFGPVNTLDIHPQGTGFTSGSEDGYVRVHNFDKDYYTQHSAYDDLEALTAQIKK